MGRPQYGQASARSEASTAEGRIACNVTSMLWVVGSVMFLDKALYVTA